LAWAEPTKIGLFAALFFIGTPTNAIHSLLERDQHPYKTSKIR
jgi:hypothetical protein